MAVRLNHGADELDEVHDINVTPFIDVILVFLIFFMVAAPLATVDLPVDLPASSAQQQPRPSKPIYLTIKADLSLAIGDDAITANSQWRRSMPRLGQIRMSAFSCAPIALCRTAPSCKS